MRRDIGRDIRREGKKAALLFFLLAFLSGCGREESRISVGSVGESAEKVSVDEQKPLLVIPSSAEWIDLVFVWKRSQAKTGAIDEGDSGNV